MGCGAECFPLQRTSRFCGALDGRVPASYENITSRYNRSSWTALMKVSRPANSEAGTIQGAVSRIVGALGSEPHCSSYHSKRSRFGLATPPPPTFNKWLARDCSPSSRATLYAPCVRSPDARES